MCGNNDIFHIVDIYVLTLFTKRILDKVTFVEEMKVLLPILVNAMVMGGCVYLLDCVFAPMWHRLLSEWQQELWCTQSLHC